MRLVGNADDSGLVDDAEVTLDNDEEGNEGVKEGEEAEREKGRLTEEDDITLALGDGVADKGDGDVILSAVEEEELVGNILVGMLVVAGVVTGMAV